MEPLPAFGIACHPMHRADQPEHCLHVSGAPGMRPGKLREEAQRGSSERKLREVQVASAWGVDSVLTVAVSMSAALQSPRCPPQDTLWSNHTQNITEAFFELLCACRILQLFSPLLRSLTVPYSPLQSLTVPYSPLQSLSLQSLHTETWVTCANVTLCHLFRGRRGEVLLVNFREASLSQEAH